MKVYLTRLGRNLCPATCLKPDIPRAFQFQAAFGVPGGIEFWMSKKHFVRLVWRPTLLQINDTHDYLEPNPELSWFYDGPTMLTMGGFACCS